MVAAHDKNAKKSWQYGKVTYDVDDEEVMLEVVLQGLKGSSVSNLKSNATPAQMWPLSQGTLSLLQSHSAWAAPLLQMI